MRSASPCPARGAFLRGSTINVIVEKDPVPNGTRSAEIKAGIERWKQALADRGATLNVQVGDITQNVENRVVVEWVKKINLQRGGLGEARTFSKTKKEFEGTVAERTVLERISGADIRVAQDVILNATGWGNVGMYEFGHALGFSDEPTQKDAPHNVMDTNVDTRNVMTFSARDLAELDTLYGDPQGKKPVGAIQGEVRPLAGGGFHYDSLVAFRWRGAGRAGRRIRI